MGKIQPLIFYKSAQNMLISSFPCRKVHRHETENSKFCILTLKGRSQTIVGLIPHLTKKALSRLSVIGFRRLTPFSESTLNFWSIGGHYGNYGIYSDFKIHIFLIKNSDFPNTRGTLRVIGKNSTINFLQKCPKYVNFVISMQKSPSAWNRKF